MEALHSMQVPQEVHHNSEVPQDMIKDRCKVPRLQVAHLGPSTRRTRKSAFAAEAKLIDATTSFRSLDMIVRCHPGAGQ